MDTPGDDDREPIADNGSEVRCSRCGRTGPPANKCSNCGAFLQGNGAAVTHGLRRYQATGELPAGLRVRGGTAAERLQDFLRPSQNEVQTELNA